jgi:uncharacterized protein (TIGR02391 family)
MTDKAMSGAELEAAMLSDIVVQFTKFKASTPRRDLIVKFRDADVLAGLLNRNVICAKNAGRGEEFLPTAAAFEYCGNDQLRKTAKLGLTTVLYTLQNMAVGEPKPGGYTFDDLKRHASDIYPSRKFEDVTLKLGLYLARDFNVLHGFRMNTPDDTEVVWFQLGENAITLKNIDVQWDIVTSRYKRPEKIPTTSRAGAAGQERRGAVLPPGEYTYHPEIQRVSQQLFLEGHFRQAVLEAFIHLIATVKEKTRLQYDGDDLMNRAFSPKDRVPIVRFNSLHTPQEKDEHVGIWFLFKGVVGLRNYKAHVVATFDDPHRAQEYLSLASLLMRLLDTATISVEP